MSMKCERESLRVAVRWGIMASLYYHLYGEYGLQIEANEGNKILIGTRKPKALQEFLKPSINW